MRREDKIHLKVRGTRKLAAGESQKQDVQRAVSGEKANFWGKQGVSKRKFWDVRRSPVGKNVGGPFYGTKRNGLNSGLEREDLCRGLEGEPG